MIGFAVAQAYAQQGYVITITGRPDREPLDGALQRLKQMQTKVKGELVDTRNRKEIIRWVDEIAEEFGRIDVAIANAGIILPRPFLELAEEQWEEVVDTHLKGIFLFLQSVSRIMVKKQLGGSLITVASRAALRGGTGVADYARAKGRIISLTKCLARELMPYAIRANSVVSVAETRMAEALRVYRGLDVRSWNERSPRERRPQPEDIVCPFIFLGSDQSRYVAGQVIAVRISI